MKDLIVNNLYRIMGVYVGDSPSVAEKNLSRVRAFEKVGQTFEVKLVGEEYLPPIRRTVQTLEDAKQNLIFPQERIRQSLLWFSDGKTQWGQNLNDAVSLIFKGEYFKALFVYNRLFTTESLRDQYLTAVTNGLVTTIPENKLNELYGFLTTCFRQNPISQHLKNRPSKEITRSYCEDIYHDYFAVGVAQTLSVLYKKTRYVSDSSVLTQRFLEIKQSYQKIREDISVFRNFFDEYSGEYQMYIADVANAAYRASFDIISRLYDFLNKAIQKADKDEGEQIFNQVEQERKSLFSELMVNPTTPRLFYERNFYEIASGQVRKVLSALKEPLFTDSDNYDDNDSDNYDNNENDECSNAVVIVIRFIVFILVALLFWWITH